MIQPVLGILADDNDATIGWGRSTRTGVALLLLVVAPYCLAHDFVGDVLF
jgi:hypothetical protein